MSDTGTRLDLIKPEDIVPGSPWMVGQPWMKLQLDEAIQTGIIKNTDSIKMDNDSRKAFKEGVLLDSSLNHAANSANKENKYFVPKKIIERECYSNYVYPPLKRGFRSFIRITALVITAVKKFKKGMVAYRTQINRPVSDGSTLESLKDPPAKFIVFTINKVCSYGLSSAFGNGIVLANKVDGNRFVTLDDRSLSLALEYVYRKTTAEVVHFQGKKLAD